MCGICSLIPEIDYIRKYGIFNVQPGLCDRNRSESLKCVPGMAFRRSEHCKQSHPFGEARSKGKGQEWRAVATCNRFPLHNPGSMSPVGESPVWYTDMPVVGTPAVETAPGGIESITVNER